MGKFSDYEYRKQPGTGHTSGVNSIFLGHLILGWLLTGLLVAALAGIIKKD
jgi:hypothetical protein